MRNERILVAYFSHKGENYSNGNIVTLEKGNTEIAAELIAEYKHAELFEIESETEYPFGYRACVEVSKNELLENARPKLKKEKSVSDYDRIYLGYPNWCGTMPMPVWTFLEDNDFSGKIICPFCTNEGSKMGRSEADIRKLAPGAELREGLPIHGSSVEKEKEKIFAWADRQ